MYKSFKTMSSLRLSFSLNNAYCLECFFRRAQCSCSEDINLVCNNIRIYYWPLKFKAILFKERCIYYKMIGSLCICITQNKL